MSVARTMYCWVRDIMAIVGVLGSAAVASVVFLFFWYQPPQEYAREGARQPSLEDARTMLYRAGMERVAAQRLIAAVDGPWTDGRHIAAYCVEASGVGAKDDEWGSPAKLDPLLSRAAAAGLDSAHAALPCIPSARVVGAMNMPLKLISAKFSAGRLEEVEVSVRDPATGVFYLVSAMNPEQWQPARTAP